MAFSFRDQLLFKAAYGGATVDLDIIYSLTDSNTATNTCVFNDAAGTAVGITLLASGHTGTVSYSLTNSDGGAFSINPNTGVVSVGLIAPTVGTRLIVGTATSSSGQTFSANFYVVVTTPVIAYVPTTFTAVRTRNVTSVAEFRTYMSQLQPGDDIVFAAGTYTATDTAWSTASGGADALNGADARYRGAFSVETSGTAANPIRIRAADGATVNLWFTPPLTPQTLAAPVFSVYNADYVIVTGLNINGTNLSTAVSSGFCTIIESDYVYFEDNEIDGNDARPRVTADDNHGGLFMQTARNCRVANNLIHSMINNPGSNNGQGIYTYSVQNTVVEYNTVHTCRAIGIYFKGSSADTMQFDSVGNIARYNHVYSCDRFGIDANNINFLPSGRGRIYQNLVVGSGIAGIVLNDAPENAGGTDGCRGYVDVVNNTILSTTAPAYDRSGALRFSPFIADAPMPTGTVARGNLIAYTTGTCYSLCLAKPAANYDSDYNWLMTADAALRQIQDYPALVIPPIVPPATVPPPPDTTTPTQTHNTLALAQADLFETHTGTGADPFNNYAGGDYTLHPTNYTGGSFVPDVLNLNSGSAVPPGCYITGTEQIGAV